MGIDLRAFIVISAAFGALCAFVLFVMRSGFPRDIMGLTRWGCGCVSMAVAALLFTMRGSIPVLFSSFLPNLLVAAGVIAMHGSIREFGGSQRKDRDLLLLVGAAGLCLATATFMYDDYRARVIIMSCTLATLFAACALATFRLQRNAFAERFTGFIFLTTAGIMLMRCIAALFQSSSLTPETDTSWVHKIYMATFSFSIVALSIGFMLIINRALHSKLEALALRDDMTGVYRREAFLAVLSREMTESKLTHRAMSVLMMDLDNFKDINDRHGHPIGDRVITDFSAKVLQILRRDDAIGRYGGEEFLVLLPHTPKADAYGVADRIRTIAAEVWSADIPSYTVSIGVATLETAHADSAALIDAADKALYAAKRAGKNRVEAAHNLADSRSRLGQGESKLPVTGILL
ncbi:GGDEF domain-containing protein [Noviherbaspirillum sp. Root189]|uniref:GGDEF domain-containing protein n=1 Tax=Noviherbaspirillum sp. Root189 TaxID=1736487 RepID=UPI0012E3EA28|nr:GGDEF domain-containing protein [Noviherbaspirillum sp. Root189]